jgi:hypothetical protein
VKEEKLCVTCHEPLKGKYCYNCGEKVVEDKDFLLKTLFQQFVDGFSNFDAKFVKSFYYLLLKPGQLSLNYVNGLRVPFMKPFQLFIVVNILFFFFLGDADIFRIPAKWYFSNEINVESKLNEAISLDLLKQKYESESLTNSKLFIFILLPFFSLVFWLMNWNKKINYGKHFIFAIHYLSFFMLFSVSLVITPKDIWTPKAIQIVIFTVNFIYLFFAMRNFYKDNIIITTFKTLICVMLCFILIFSYRDLVSHITFKLL